MIATTSLSLTAALLALAASTSIGTPSASAGADTASDREALLAGISELPRQGAPGRIAVFGERAFALVTGGKPDAPDAPDVMAAAARLGAGRVVAVAHEGYLSAEGEATTRFLRNALAFAAGRHAGARVGLWGLDDGVHGRVEGLGHVALRVDGPPRAAGGDEGLDAIVWARPREVDAETVDALIAFVEGGGGLVLGVCPWGYEQVGRARGADLRTTLSMNQVLAPAGLAFAPGTTRATGDSGFRIDPEAAREASAHAALVALEADRADDVSNPAFAMLELSAFAAPDRAAGFRERVAAVLEGVDVERLPHPDRPLKRDRPLERLYVSFTSRAWRDLSPDEVRAAPGADHFPGAVPDDAPRVTREAPFEAAIRGWQGTGLYAAPGEVVEVEATAPEGWRVLVGCHRDRLWGKDRWRRWPEVTAEFELAAGVNRIATPFGGSLYLEARDRGGRQARNAHVTIRGAVEAPRFTLTGWAEKDLWEKTRHAPAPWGELEGARIVLSVPSEALRALEDPGPVVRFWDAVMESHLALAGRRLERRERFVADVQISAGYMHSGYPIMTQFDQVRVPQDGGLARVLDVETLRREGSWGHFHELGHNLQRPAWTFGGTGEVTCNFFSLYTMEKVCGIEPWEHPWLARQKPKAETYLAAPDFGAWKRQAGVALVTYAQLQREFGWAPFETVLAEYEAEGRDAWPRTDPERIETFARRFSEAVGVDLGPFFRAWGWPVKLRELDGLPTSRPELLRID